MSEIVIQEGAGFRYIKGVSQYSGGVAAQPGYRLERVQFTRMLPLEEGFKAIAAHLRSLNRPLDAFCACELRSPKPFSEQEFKEFNQRYVMALKEFHPQMNGVNPVARTNVCLEIDPAPVECMYAFTYTMPDETAKASNNFVVSGSGEVPEGKSTYRDHVIRLGDRSPEGVRAKAQWVSQEMERRMGLLGFEWKNSTGTQLYTVQDIHHFLADDLVRRGAAKCGLNWHFSRPPVAELDYEMDVRGVSRELVI